MYVNGVDMSMRSVTRPLPLDHREQCQSAFPNERLPGQ